MAIDVDKQRGILEGISRHYNVYEGFDRRQNEVVGEMMAERVRGKRTLELGCANGLITGMLLKTAAALDVVDGAGKYIAEVTAKYGPAISAHVSLFEEYDPPCKYEAVVFANTLHHIHAPEALLERIRGWVAPGGRLYITAPNMLSLHRRLGVLMGKLKDTHDATERNLAFDQPGRYTKASLIAQLERAGYRVVECHGFFLKPFSHAQMETLDPSPELMKALCQMGRELEEYASLIFAEAEPLR
ncbi:MAG: methyltransferase domain-containing protein [Nitrospinae bacterium]|nr:methyltransferase domain-containing protein [Nitrospinota bacterium]